MRTRLVLAVLVAAALTSCDDSAANPADVSAGDAANARPEAPANLIVWFLDGGLSNAQLNELTQHNVQQCLRNHGFRYVPYAASTGEPLGRRDLAAYRAAHGYGLADSSDAQPAVVDANAAIVAELSRGDSERYVLARHTCEGSAEQTTVLTAPSVVLPAEELAASFAVTAADRRLTAGLKAWSTCMAAAGFAGLVEPGLVPGSVESIAAERFAGDLREAEIAVATADVRCQAAHLDSVLDSVWKPEIDRLMALYTEMGYTMPSARLAEIKGS